MLCSRKTDFRISGSDCPVGEVCEVPSLLWPVVKVEEGSGCDFVLHLHDLLRVFHSACSHGIDKGLLTVEVLS